MREKPIGQILKSPRPANSLTQVVGQSERVKAIVEECAVDLSSVNSGLQRELMDGQISPGIENALEDSQAVLGKVHSASDALSRVNRELKEEVHERVLLQEKLDIAVRQGDEARHASLHDPLTGLPNRALFNDRLEHELAHAKRAGRSLVVMFLDLDDFKRINDTHGHEVGDIVLKTIADRIKQASRDEDTVCRHGGDEFLYLLAQIKNKRDITIIAKKLVALVKVPCDIEIRDLRISLTIHPSIGVAVFPEDGTTADLLVANADKAMYDAKRQKSGYSLFGNKDLLAD